MPRGAYGSVTFSPDGGRAIKRAKLFDDQDTLMGINLNEAILASTPRHTPNVMKAYSVRVRDGKDIEIEMDRGMTTLFDFCMKTEFEERINTIDYLLKHMVIGLQSLHKHGLIHCDFKPENVMIGDMKTQDATVVRIIDFGSTRFHKRYHTRGVLCTYPFSAPEALAADAVPTPQCDAYSLGATLMFMLYKRYAYDFRRFKTAEEVSFAHKGGFIKIPAHTPEVPFHLYNIMTKLLHPNPTKRMTIAELYTQLVDEEEEEQGAACDGFVIDCDDEQFSFPGRKDVIETMYLSAKGHASKFFLTAFPLSVNIMDRYRVAKGSNFNVDDIIIAACLNLSTLTLFPDVQMRSMSKPLKVAMLDVMSALEFKLYANTCDLVLRYNYHVKFIDMNRLKCAIQDSETGTCGAVSKYLLG